jgi:hypothetical protein
MIAPVMALLLAVPGSSIFSLADGSYNLNATSVTSAARTLAIV